MLDTGGSNEAESEAIGKVYESTAQAEAELGEAPRVAAAVVGGALL